MPLARYFTFVGSLLLALLFLADWYFPKLVAAPAGAGVDKTIIRLHSAHKWPEAIVFDTTLPTLVPPPSLALAESLAERLPPARPARSSQQAFALALPEPMPVRAEQSPAPPKQVQRRRVRTTAANARRIASDETGGGFRTVQPAGW
jgi:hypothetical protein